jgi:hypothetical protein
LLQRDLELPQDLSRLPRHDYLDRDLELLSNPRKWPLDQVDSFLKQQSYLEAIVLKINIRLIKIKIKFSALIQPRPGLDCWEPPASKHPTPGSPPWQWPAQALVPPPTIGTALRRGGLHVGAGDVARTPRPPWPLIWSDVYDSICPPWRGIATCQQRVHQQRLQLKVLEVCG